MPVKNARLCQDITDNCKNPECERWFRRDERFENCPVCGTSRKCNTVAMRGSPYCYEHDRRRTPKGSNLVTGKNSQSEIAKVASKYVETTRSGPYLSLVGPIEWVDNELVSLMERMEENDSPKRVKRLIDRWNAFKFAFKSLKDLLVSDNNLRKAYNSMEEEVTKAYHDYESRKQIIDLIDQRRKLSVDEIKIFKDFGAMLTAKDAMEMSGQLSAAVIRVLRDEPNGQKYIQQIIREFAVILGESNIDESQGRGGEVIDIHPGEVDRDELFYSRDATGPTAPGQDAPDAVSEGHTE